jgi:molecular chaperone Hsp33
MEQSKELLPKQMSMAKCAAMFATQSPNYRQKPTENLTFLALSVPIYTGEIAEDFAYYLLKSEQIPSAVLLGVLLQNDEPFVKAAGGIMLQMMPGANEHIITMIEDTIRHAPHLTTVINEGATPKDLIELALGIIDYEILEEKPVEFACNCSMERTLSMIESLGKTEVEAMLLEDKGATITCGFCNQVYQVDENQLREILDSI